jgi:tetratricopeptide (TPR) repeat protein
MDGSGQSPRPTAALSADLSLLKTAVRSDLVEDLAKSERRPPPLKASWPYAKDIVVVVVDGTPLKVGGYVRGQEPVHPITLNVKSKTPAVTYDGRWNAIVASPDESEIAFIGHFFCMEWCNEIVITRLTPGELASAIYNDTGFRLHQKKDYAGSRDLFLKAAWANPRAPLPPYNLACAYALLGDEANAEKALKLAIAIGGDKVKPRAQKDADFTKVRDAKWFTTLTGGG